MNRLGHVSQATAVLPIIIFAPLYYNYDNTFFQYMKNIMNIFVNLEYFVIILSILRYFIGSTILDFIDFKIIKPLMPPHKRQKQYFFHRQWTHGVIPNLTLLVLAFFLIENSNSQLAFMFLFLMLGILTHLIGDFFTGSLPIFFYGHYNKSGRVGINRIIPKFFKPIFSTFIPKLANSRIVSTIFFMSSIYFFKELEGDKYFTFF